MAKQEDISDTRQAARALEQAVSSLLGHYPDSVDAQRLRLDCSRVLEDLDLLCGAQPAAAAPPLPPAPAPLTVIADTPYAHDFWMDAEDEGLGQADYRTR